MRAHEAGNAEIARATAYKLLAECYYPPGQATGGHVGQLGASLKALGSPAAEAAERLQAAWQAHEGFEALAIDHARLFVGPFALLAPPYGSVYLEGERRLMGDSALEAGECYQEVGLEVAAGFSGTPDHIAAELEFMHFLILKELEALVAGHLDRAQNLRQKQRAFLERHLAAWVPDFARNVEERAETSFYQNLAAATRVFVAGDFEQIRSARPALMTGRAPA